MQQKRARKNAPVSPKVMSVMSPNRSASAWTSTAGRRTSTLVLWSHFSTSEYSSDRSSWAAIAAQNSAVVAPAGAKTAARYGPAASSSAPAFSERTSRLPGRAERKRRTERIPCAAKAKAATARVLGEKDRMRWLVSWKSVVASENRHTARVLERTRCGRQWQRPSRCLQGRR